MGRGGISKGIKTMVWQKWIVHGKVDKILRRGCTLEDEIWWREEEKRNWEIIAVERIQIGKGVREKSLSGAEIKSREDCIFSGERGNWRTANISFHFFVHV